MTPSLKSKFVKWTKDKYRSIQNSEGSCSKTRKTTDRFSDFDLFNTQDPLKSKTQDEACFAKAKAREEKFGKTKRKLGLTIKNSTIGSNKQQNKVLIEDCGQAKQNKKQIYRMKRRKNNKENYTLDHDLKLTRD